MLSPSNLRRRYDIAKLAEPIRFISFERDAPEIDDDEYRDILEFEYQLDVLEYEIPEDAGGYLVALVEVCHHCRIRGVLTWEVPYLQYA